MRYCGKRLGIRNAAVYIGALSLNALVLYLIAFSGYETCNPPAAMTSSSEVAADVGENGVAGAKVLEILTKAPTPCPQPSAPLPCPHSPSRSSSLAGLVAESVPRESAPAEPDISTRVLFKPPPQIGSYSAVGMTAVADRGAQAKFAVSIKSQRCYAERHSYEYIVLDPSNYPKCRQRDFFFRKHCTVARFLETRPPGYILFVLDGDNPVVVLDRNLDRWLAEARITDVVLYERWMNNEIMAGNYAVRNSAWGIQFCDGWAAYDQVDQPIGFHSSDNGAIHMHVIRELHLTNWNHCAYLWNRLTADSMNLDPYYHFVSCTRLLMGAPRRWKVDGVYRITILPRGHSWSIDGGIADSKTSTVGPISHHGQKEEHNYLQYFKPEFVKDPKSKCTSMLRSSDSGVVVSEARFFEILANSHRGTVNGGWQSWSRQPLPPWYHVYLQCIPTLTCQPLEYGDPLPVSFVQPPQGSLPFLRVPKGLKFEWCAKEHDKCSCVGLSRFGTIEDGKLSTVVRVAADSGQTICNADHYGREDPAPGAGKSCYCAKGV